MNAVPDFGDPLFSIWRMGWVYEQWRGDPRPLFSGNIFYPEPLESFPSPNRLPIMQWFAGWLEREGIDAERIYSTHGDVPATKEHLAKLRR